jgi:hypothetical protein
MLSPADGTLISNGMRKMIAIRSLLAPVSRALKRQFAAPVFCFPGSDLFQ